MKHVFNFLTLAFLCPIFLVAQNIEKEIKSRQFADAWEKLQEASLDRQVDFALKYFAQTRNHQLFVFKNMQPNESLMEARVQQDYPAGDFIAFPIDTLLKEQIRKEPKNGVWHQKLGDYYYDVYVRYGSNWLANRQEVMRLYNVYYTKADELGQPSVNGYYARGKYLAFTGEIDSAKQLFLEAIDLDPLHAPSAYNLCYLYRDEFIYGEEDSALLDSSIAFGRIAVKEYPDAYRRDKSDVVYQLAKSYELNQQCDSAIKYYLLSDALVPEQIKVMYPLLDCFLKENRIKGAKLIASKLLGLDVKNNRIFNDLVGFFGENNQFPSMEEWLIEERAEDIHDKERTGYLNFYISNVQGFQEEYEKALSTLAKAEEDFNICYDPNHVIFRVISKTRDNLKAKISE